ncbi:hypothetical protein [Lentzea sp. CA-135723]|uniref:hypothetical protein n=1 Tax=Lentzea sp. CA-135723 TaxID=3239950 RepID=UPI003D8CB706
MNAAGGAMGVAGFLADPLAGLIGAGFGWLIEHVPFLREPLDWLTGDQQQLDSMSKTWGNVANHLDQVSTDLEQWVKTDAGRWSGQEFRAYETFGVDKADTYASGAQGISVLVNVCKTILNVVRGIVRDLISEAVGKLISICVRWAPAMAAFGAGVAGVIAECTATAVKYANKSLGWCKKLSKAFSNATGLFGKLENVFQGAVSTTHNGRKLVSNQDTERYPALASFALIGTIIGWVLLMGFMLWLLSRKHMPKLSSSPEEIVERMRQRDDIRRE